MPRLAPMAITPLGELGHGPLRLLPLGTDGAAAVAFGLSALCMEALVTPDRVFSQRCPSDRAAAAAASAHKEASSPSPTLPSTTGEASCAACFRLFAHGTGRVGTGKAGRLLNMMQRETSGQSAPALR
mmetsp:Transcript_118479/g.330524  ORF Transcript_118479/g.330524 Transcript_118479/m.330524 type:complete len:128 (-) Transcript_118479:8-391(-)